MAPAPLASGAGAISRQVMGGAVIGGMLAATGIAIFMIPVTFYVVEKITGKKGDHKPPAATESSQGGDHA